jgi:phosphoribosylcarboxyaminoimidazole (NCAIR) mutase
MPPGVPVATVAIGKRARQCRRARRADDRARGCGLAARLKDYKKKLEAKVEAAAERLKASAGA